jgi:hypothetical protein
MSNITANIYEKLIVTGNITQPTPIVGEVIATGAKGEKGDPGETYIHPDTHPAEIIVESSDRKFVTSSEKTILENFSYNYIHDQMVANDTWVINHNMSKYPSVTVVDSSNSVCIGDVEYTTSNSLVVRFIGGFAGKAYLN